MLRETVGAGKVDPKRVPAVKGEVRAPSSRLYPRRLKTSEGWDVLIGRSNEDNDYLRHKLARVRLCGLAPALDTGTTSRTPRHLSRRCEFQSVHDDHFLERRHLDIG